MSRERRKIRAPPSPDGSPAKTIQPRPNGDTPLILMGTPLWNAFVHAFLQDHGMHLGAFGQTESGKTNKSYILGEWLIDAGETIVIFDCGKTGEILPWMNFGLPLNIITPPGCRVEIKNAPVSVSYETADTPEVSWTFVKKGHINIFSFRAFILDGVSYGSYTSRVMNALLNQVMYGSIKVPVPLSIFMDEFSEICPSYGLIENRHQKETASRIAKVLKKIRGEKIRIIALDQAWTDIYPNARRQFPFLLICRAPNLIGQDVKSLEKYQGLYDGLDIDQALMIFPRKNWCGVWDFPFVRAPEGSEVKYFGEYFIARKKKRVTEHWIKAVDEDEEGIADDS